VHSNPEAVKLKTMSDHNGLSLEEYLAAKTETQLRSYLFKMKRGVARLNGSKEILVRRTVQAFLGLSGERQLEVLPGYLRARQNWRRTSSLAARVSRNPPPVAAPPPPPPAFLNALASLNASVGLVNANRLAVAAPPLPNFVTAPALPNPPPGAPLPAPAQQGGARSRLQAMASEVRTPIGRSRQRSRSMTSSPSALLEEYKTRWTCKVCLVAEVEVLLQPCGHLCLCEPCSQAIRSHFLAARLRDLMFGGPIPRTPCPICRRPIEQSVKVFV